MDLRRVCEIRGTEPHPGHQYAKQGQQATEQGAETAEAMAEYNKASSDAASGTTKLGALLREQLESRSE